MVAPRTTAAVRDREARENAARRRRLSVRMGAAGVALLFLGGLGTVLATELVVPMLGLMVVGIVLVVGALLAIQDALRDLRSLTKIL